MSSPIVENAAQGRKDNVMTERRRMCRSRSNRILAGVCGGVSEFFQIDPTIVRLLWFLSIFLGGTGIILYIVAMIIMPANPSHDVPQTPENASRFLWGIAFVGVGVLVLLYNLGVFPFIWWSIPWKLLFAVLLIAIGTMLIFSHGRRRSVETDGSEKTEQASLRRRFYRSIRDRKIFGVCGGLGDFFDIDPTIVRLLFVLLTLFSAGFGIVAYLILTIVTPEEQIHATTA